MKRLFMDTDVLIDFLTNRSPHADMAARLFELRKERETRLFISAVSVSNIYYVTRKFASHTKVIRSLNGLRELVTIQDTTSDIISDALASGFKDFEDGIQYNSALSIKKIDAIVTRNTKDYKRSLLPVLTPETAVRLILQDS